MKILIATNHLEKIGGTESFTYALASSLKKQGFDVEYFCIQTGSVAERIEALGVPFMSRKRYDLILVNHNTVVDRLCGKGTIIQTCHGVIPMIEQPSRYADIHVGVSNEVTSHLKQLGFQATTMWNGIDCDRFIPSSELHDTLTTVLSLCQSETAHEAIKSCCDKLHVTFLRADKKMDDVWSVEALINRADLVVGIGRSLYDAMSCGRAILSFDIRDYNKQTSGYGYLSSDNIERAMSDNCVNRHTETPLTLTDLERELQKYSKNDGDFFRQFALRNLNMDIQVQKYIQLYQKYLAVQANTPLLKKIKRILSLKTHQFYVWQKFFFRLKKSSHK